MVARVPGLTPKHAAERALHRLEQVLSERVHARVHAFGDALVFGELRPQNDPTEVAGTFVLDLAEAITRRCRVEMRYRSPGKADSVRSSTPTRWCS